MPSVGSQPPGTLVGVDVGGTFTDAAVVTGTRVVTAKVPSTPRDQSIGVVEAVHAALEAAGLEVSDVARLTHGMTVGTNALLERTGACTALVTTEGFRDVVEIRRQNRAHLYRLGDAHPAPVVPFERRFEVTERCGPDGVIVPLDENSLDEVIRNLDACGAEAVAVGLLFSFRHPEHERLIAERIGRDLPHLSVSISSDVSAEIREYERFSTVCVDATLGPVLGRYLGTLGERTREAGLPDAAIMQSNGGTLAREEAARHAALTVLSGPAAGVIGARHVAERLAGGRALTFDMGGTSCDVALIDGEPQRTSETSINGYDLYLPMLDIHTVSAGGGSIAWIDSGGALRVGPQSAGADPGPACYGRGGTEATVTDANVVLGRIPVDAPLSGDLTLDADAAATAVGRIAADLAMGLEECAEGIVAVAVNEMVRALRVVSVERGVDPRDMALIAFGGAGPLHACDVAREMDMRTVILPHGAGALAALGLVMAPERRDVAQTVLLSMDDGPALLAAREALSARLPDDAPHGREWRLDCRYVGQTHSIDVPWEPGEETASTRARFDDLHERRTGAADATRPVEVVTVRLAAIGPSIVPAFGGVTRSLPARGPATFPLEGATGWLAEGWSIRTGDLGAVICER